MTNSSRRYFLRSFSTVDQEEHGHAYSQPVGHLLEYDRAATVGNLAVDFHYAINRAGMHDQHVGLGATETGFVQPEKAGVFADARKHRLALALVLDAQQVDDVSIGDGFFDV